MAETVPEGEGPTAYRGPIAEAGPSFGDSRPFSSPILSLTLALNAVNTTLVSLHVQYRFGDLHYTLTSKLRNCYSVSAQNDHGSFEIMVPLF